MKKTRFPKTKGFALGFLVVTIGSLSSLAQDSRIGRRWDLRMIKEAPIWANLLKNYFYAEHRRYWPERKAALESVVNGFPQSQWADDAALILACGKASFENNPAGALLDLDRVAKQYPRGQTVVASWNAEEGCRFDQVWLIWQAGLAYLASDGKVRAAKAFDKDGQIFQKEREALAYFDHLERCPARTAKLAMLFKAQIQESGGDTAAAMAALEAIVSDAEGYMAELFRADREAGEGRDGFYIRTSLRRPESEAYFSLIDMYAKGNAPDKAKEKAKTLFSACSPDGWRWEINSRLGDMYARIGLPEQAREQYKLTQNGLASLRKYVEAESKLVEGSDFPKEFWESRNMELKTKLEKLVRKDRD